jgi:hypothetical protein
MFVFSIDVRNAIRVPEDFYRGVKPPDLYFALHLRKRAFYEIVITGSA